MKKENVKIESQGSVCQASDFGIEGDVVVASPLVISQSVRVHLQNSRQGTVACKSRSDLTSRSNKKPWKQKGTGRARAGSPRSPLWRGGGVCFGPQPRTRVLSMPYKMNRKSLQYLFLDLLDAKKVVSLFFEPVKKNTKDALAVLKNAGFDDQKVIVLYDIIDSNVYYSFANLSNVNLISYDAIHPYALANDRYLLFLSKDKEQFQNVVNKWLN